MMAIAAIVFASSITFVPGQIGELYELPSWVGNLTMDETYVVGNDVSYSDKTTIHVPNEMTVTRTLFAETNSMSIVTNSGFVMPFVELENTTDTFKWNTESSYVDDDSSTAVEVPDVYDYCPDVSWWGRFNNYYWTMYHANAKNYRTVTHSTPHYSCDFIREQVDTSSHQAYRHMVATCEANVERMYYASQGDWPTNVAMFHTPVVTNWVETMTNEYSYSTYGFHVETNIVGTVTNFIQKVDETVHHVTNVVARERGPFRSVRFSGEDYDEISKTRGEIIARITDPMLPHEDQIAHIPGSIIRDPAWDVGPHGEKSPLHWWSTSRFGNWIPSSYDWFVFDRERLVNCCVNFGMYESQWNDIPSESNPMSCLLWLSQVGSEHQNDYFMSMSEDYPYKGRMCGIMTKWFNKCLQSRGGKRIQEDEDETWVDDMGRRKKAIVLAGMNQMLVLQDRTIHIPKFEFTNVVRESWMKLEERYETYSNSTVKIHYDRSLDKWVSGPIRQKIHLVTENHTNYPRAYMSDRIEVYMDRREYGQVCFGGSLEIGYARILTESFIGPYLIPFCDQTKEWNVISFTTYINRIAANQLQVEIEVADIPIVLGVVEVPDDLEIPIFGFANFDAYETDRWVENAPVQFLGAVQPCSNGWDRVSSAEVAIMDCIKYSIESNNNFVAGTNLVRVSKNEYDEGRKAIEDAVGDDHRVVEQKMESMSPRPLTKNGSIAGRGSDFADLCGNPIITSEVSFSGEFLVKDVGLLTQQIFYKATGGSTNSLPAPFGLVSMNYQMDNYGNPYTLMDVEYDSKANLHPMTKVDWDWKSMHEE